MICRNLAECAYGTLNSKDVSRLFNFKIWDLQKEVVLSGDTGTASRDFTSSI